jgi:hypothetical protein
VLGIALRFFPIAKALLYFEGMAVDPVCSGEALNSATIVIDILVRGELSNHSEFLLSRRGPFTIAEIPSPWWLWEDKGSDSINPNLCTVLPSGDYLRGKRCLFVHHFG